VNRLFVAYKPKGVVCNHFLSRLKRKYSDKKAGFSGTLDPFAQGVLIVAFGQFTKLFRFLNKAPKTYRATLWLGAYSPTLDSEKIERVQTLMAFHPDSVKIAVESMVGAITYLPPKYSAKKVEGKRAYALARDDKDFELNAITSQVYACHVVHYVHPFLTFEISISEGGYVRSIGALIAKKLGFEGALSALERLSEGVFVYEDEKPLNPLECINLPLNAYLREKDDILLGRKLLRENFEITEEGVYCIVIDEKLSIIEMCNDEVNYLLNSISLEVSPC